MTGMTLSAQKIADLSYSVFTEGKEQFRDRLREALFASMRAGEAEKLLKALNDYAERVVPKDEKEKRMWVRNQAGRQYWDLCYDIAQRIPLTPDEITVPSKVVAIQNRKSVSGERHLVAAPIAFPTRAIINEHIDLRLDEMNERLRKEFGVSGHWFPGLVDDYPVAELHVTEWLKVHDELFYDRLTPERIQELRFDALRRSERFHYGNSDQNWDWDFLVVLGSVEGNWTPEAIQAVREHLQEVILPSRLIRDDSLEEESQPRPGNLTPEGNPFAKSDPFAQPHDPFVVGQLDFLRQAQYQGGWLAKQRAVEDFLNRTKGPFRLSKVEGGMMRGWVLSNGAKDWLYVTPEMNGKNWEECLMMIWEAFERNGVKTMYVGQEKPKPGTVPAFVRS
jgi:hypothetical protein